jgi:hypothetical protein
MQVGPGSHLWLEWERDKAHFFESKTGTLLL